MSSAPMVSWAQNREDIVLWRALGDISAGCYVDVGAADPDHDSVTKLFYERGWCGVNIEPVADLAARLIAERERDRTIQLCAGSVAGSAVFYRVENSGLSSMDEGVLSTAADAGLDVVEEEVEVRRLDEILSSVELTPDGVHFLKIDVEGLEKDVLLGLDRSVWRPWVVVVEATKPNSTEQAHEQWEPELLGSGYEFCLFDGLNRFYVAAEHSELKAALSYPACALDTPFITAGHRKALDAYRENLESSDRLDDELQKTLAAYGRQESELTRVADAYRDQESEMASIAEAHRSVSEENATLRAGVIDMAEEIDELRRRHEGRTELLRSEVEMLQSRIDQMCSSTAWKITAPLRSGADLAKRGIGRRDA